MQGQDQDLQQKNERKNQTEQNEVRMRIEYTVTFYNDLHESFHKDI